MKTEKVLMTLLLSLIVLASIANLAIAQTSAEVNSNTDISASIDGKAGITPDSIFYGFKTFGEKIKLVFTFKQETKAKAELGLAHKRLLEAREMADKGNVKAFEKAQLRYGLLVEKAQNRIEAIDKEGSADKIRASVKGVIGLETAVQMHKYNIDRLKDRVENANHTDEQKAKFEDILSRMSNKTDELDQKLIDREDKIKTKLRAVTEKNETEIDDEIKDIKHRVNFTATIQTVAKARIDAAQNSLDKLKERQASGELKVNVTIAQERIDLATSAIASAQVLYDQGKYEEAIKAIKPFGNFGRSISEIKKEMNEERKELKNEVKENIKKAQERAREEIKDAKEKIRERVKKEVNKDKQKENTSAKASTDSEVESDDDSLSVETNTSASVSLTA